ncbi:MAG: N-acetyltransferase [Alphaproteobacteria bacterium]|nr:N-acetyltransferase [Alphaproteobacteria bacterium]MDE1984924.1 N-acetyltransferase [Alphaproteobacteria bacterium]MDE2162268.1 N-acetyltransferase [Alphaproteobacteria bacterium]MDE2500551.1 N-acetyltransferase [Alphaproteobacteria bacterium]
MTAKDPTWQIRPERPEDAPLVEALNEASFGPGRFAKSAYRLREGVDPVAGLSFVSVEEGELRGSIRFWPVAIGMEQSLLLGPLAVQSHQRGRGIGIALMKRGIEEARTQGHASIILVGDEPYYVRVGFAALPPGRVRFPGPVDPARILGQSLKPNVILTLAGEVRRAHIDHPFCADGAGLG